MRATQWIERLLASTRGQIIALLRRSSLTVNELAEALELTDNAVRAHLSALERDGLVEQRTGPRRGVGKPAQLYSLTTAADALLPKAYAPVLGILLDTLSERMAPEEMETLLREVGRRAGSARAWGGADLRMRIDAAYGVLGELGGVADVEEADGVVHIRGHSCPLAEMVPRHPQVCAVAEALLAEIVGLPVREHCDKGARPRCRFEIALA